MITITGNGEKIQIKKTKPLKWKTAQRLLKGTKEDKKYNRFMMLLCGFYLGLRIGDILQLKWSHILNPRYKQDPIGNEIPFFYWIPEKTSKKRKAIEVVIPKDFSNWIKGVPIPDNTDTYIFVDQRNGTNKTKPISAVAANKRLINLFSDYDVELENPGSHTLRKTFGRRFYEKNGKTEHALISLSNTFKHSSIAITRKYIGLEAEVRANMNYGI